MKRWAATAATLSLAALAIAACTAGPGKPLSTVGGPSASPTVAAPPEARLQATTRRIDITGFPVGLAVTRTGSWVLVDSGRPDQPGSVLLHARTNDWKLETCKRFAGAPIAISADDAAEWVMVEDAKGHGAHVVELNPRCALRHRYDIPGSGIDVAASAGTGYALVMFGNGPGRIEALKAGRHVHTWEVPVTGRADVVALPGSTVVVAGRGKSGDLDAVRLDPATPDGPPALFSLPQSGVPHAVAMSGGVLIGIGNVDQGGLSFLASDGLHGMRSSIPAIQAVAGSGDVWWALGEGSSGNVIGSGDLREGSAVDSVAVSLNAVGPMCAFEGDLWMISQLSLTHVERIGSSSDDG